MANNTKVFGESTTNILTDNEFASNQERVNGYQPNTPINSKIMNSVLRQNSVFVAGLSEYISEAIADDEGATLNLGPNAPLSEVVATITDFFNYLTLDFQQTYWDKMDYIDKTNRISYYNGTKFIPINPLTNVTNYDQVLIYGKDGTYKYKSENDLTLYSCEVSQRAELADGISEFENTSSGAKVSFIGSNLDFETIVDDVDNSKNVTSQINGKNITNIFETDGTTAKKATEANKLAPLNTEPGDMVYFDGTNLYSILKMLSAGDLTLPGAQGILTSIYNEDDSYLAPDWQAIYLWNIRRQIIDNSLQNTYKKYYLLGEFSPVGSLTTCKWKSFDFSQVVYSLNEANCTRVLIEIFNGMASNGNNAYTKYTSTIISYDKIPYGNISNIGQNSGGYLELFSNDSTFSSLGLKMFAKDAGVLGGGNNKKGQYLWIYSNEWDNIESNSNYLIQVTMLP